MKLYLDHTKDHIKQTEIRISGSKSESNRLLILQKFYPVLRLENLSDSDDTKHLQKALESDQSTVDIGHAGTAMRFLTAYFAVHKNRKVILTGSERMQERPVKILVDALNNMGADITYMNKEGFPPLKITGKEPLNNTVRIEGSVSSQYISALMLIAGTLKNGLNIELTGKVTSVPYLKMTLALLEKIGIDHTWHKNIINIRPKSKVEPQTLVVESDWSSASYFYSLAALGEKVKLSLSSFKKDSLQGDSSLTEIYKHFGVETQFTDDSIIITKKEKNNPGILKLDLSGSPDLAQTIAVTCFGLGIACDLTGLHTLKIKETDRLTALLNELTKFGASIKITDRSLHLKASGKLKKDVTVKTYNDHRMAMAFAPLSVKVPLIIEDAQVVTKSYTNFWIDFENIFK